MTSQSLLEGAQGLLPQMVSWRRQFHQHPELGMEEYETAATVAAALRRLGIEVREKVGGTGVIGLIRGHAPGRTVALRADMDALPVEERTGKPYASRVKGKMHACGHDGHTATLLGVATLLARGPAGGGPGFDGQVKLIFQPAEEGPGGAAPMVRDGAMEDPHVDAVLGLHVNNDIPAGQIGLRSGVVCAAPDGFELFVRGVGGHGGHPHKSVDAIAVAAQVITAMQTLVSREEDPTNPLVITVGTIQGGFRGNIIAPEVRMTGTVRTLDPEVRAVIEERVRRLVGGICAAMRAQFELTYNYGYPSVSNDAALTGLVEESATAELGPGRVVRLERPTMGGEDFSYFAQQAPGCFIRLGTRNEAKGFVQPGHSPEFDFDEDAMAVGAAVLARAALDYLRRGL